MCRCNFLLQYECPWTENWKKGTENLIEYRESSFNALFSRVFFAKIKMHLMTYTCKSQDWESPHDGPLKPRVEVKCDFSTKIGSEVSTEDSFSSTALLEWWNGSKYITISFLRVVNDRKVLYLSGIYNFEVDTMMMIVLGPILPLEPCSIWKTVPLFTLH